MRNFPLLIGCVFSAACLAFLHAAHADVLVSDDFSSNATTGTIFSLQNSGAGAAPTDVNGSLSVKTTSAASLQRSFIASNASNINPFTSVLNVSLTGLTLNATSTAGTNGFFFGIGRTSDATFTPANYYIPNGNGFKGSSGGVGGLLGFLVNSTSTATSLAFYDTGNNAGTAATQSLTLSAVPTGFSETIDGTGMNRTVSITLTGATFSSTGSDTQTFAFTNFTSSTLGSTPESHFFLGAINNGALSTGATTSATLDFASVSTVPEPSGFVFGAVIGVMLTIRSLMVYRHRA